MPRKQRHHLALPRCLSQEITERGTSGKLLLAVSGGADSMALLRAAVAIAENNGIELFVGHLDHGLRPDSADVADWVREQATKLGIPFRGSRIDVAAEVARTGRGLEETARRLRYDWLAQITAEVGGATVATAHTADDAAETILFHLLRGSGLRGLRGIASERRLSRDVLLIRPLLAVSREEVLAYLTEIDQDYREDPSNASLQFTRNRIRHRLLPELRETINPRVEQALLRLSRQARETDHLLRKLARRELARVHLESSPSRIRLDAKRLARRPPLIIRETLRLAWHEAQWPRQKMTGAHWRALERLVREGGRHSLPGAIEARVRRGELELRRD